MRTRSRPCGWAWLLLLLLPGAAWGQLDAPRRLEELERVGRPLTLIKSPPVLSVGGPDGGEFPTNNKILAVARATEAIHIDGRLDEATWSKAAKESNFLSWMSNPYGQPATAVTEVQATYDSENLYVAFRCKNQPGAPVITGAMASEQDIYNAEFVAVTVDANHDHATYKAFMVSRGGYRADADVSGTNDAPEKWKINWEWRGEWTASTVSDDDGWTAEVAIPWATLRVPKQEEAYTLGIDFTRNAPSEISEWALSPPGYQSSKPSHFGQMTVEGGIEPGERVYLAPAVAGTYDQAANKLPLLRNFAPVNGPAGAYASLYGRVRPAGPVQLDFAVNPDFLGIPPDPALSATDRFELYYPEQRDFFLENKAALEMGPQNFQLFYSRRIGVNPDLSELPILYGLKARVLAGDTEAAVLNAATSDPNVVHISNEYTVARAQHAFEGGDRVGAIFMDRGQPGALSQYRAYGADGQLTFFDQHLRLSGFLARSDTAGAPSGYTGNALVTWTSQAFAARASYLQVDDSFDAQMGYFILTGVRQTEVGLTYTALVSSDFVNRVVFDGSTSRTLTFSDQSLIDRSSLTVYALLNNFADIGVNITRSLDDVLTDFTLAGGRFDIPPGLYPSVTADLFLDSPPGVLSASFDYQEGTFWGGYRRSPTLGARLRVGIFNGTLKYTMSQLRRPDGTEVLGHRGIAQAVMSYSADFKTSVYVDVNTLDPAVVAEMVTSYTFGHLSTVLLVVGERTSTLDGWIHAPDIQVAVKFAYGIRAL